MWVALIHALQVQSVASTEVVTVKSSQPPLVQTFDVQWNLFIVVTV